MSRSFFLKIHCVVEVSLEVLWADDTCFLSRPHSSRPPFLKRFKSAPAPVSFLAQRRPAGWCRGVRSTFFPESASKCDHHSFTGNALFDLERTAHFVICKEKQVTNCSLAAAWELNPNFVPIFAPLCRNSALVRERVDQTHFQARVQISWVLSFRCFNTALVQTLRRRIDMRTFGTKIHPMQLVVWSANL